MDSNAFKKWIEKNRNYNISLDDYIQHSGTSVLYRDVKYMLTRTDDAESTAYGTIPTELCLAFPSDESIGFENPIKKFLRHFFIYEIHIIQDCEMMHQTELLGITVFKEKRKGKKDIRWWPPLQGMGDDLYYTNFEECIIKENLNKDFLDLPEDLLQIFYNDIKKQRKKR